MQEEKGKAVCYECQKNIFERDAECVQRDRDDRRKEKERDMERIVEKIIRRTHY